MQLPKLAARDSELEYSKGYAGAEQEGGGAWSILLQNTFSQTTNDIFEVRHFLDPEQRIHTKNQRNASPLPWL